MNYRLSFRFVLRLTSYRGSLAEQSGERVRSTSNRGNLGGYDRTISLMNCSSWSLASS